MEENLAKLSDAVKCLSNPFIGKTFEIKSGRRSRIISHNAQQLVNIDTGETTDTAFMGSVYEDVDREQFVKLYVDQVGFLNDLTPTALKVFGYVVTHLKPKTDEIRIHIPTIQRFCGYKNKPFQPGHHRGRNTGSMRRFEDTKSLLRP